MGQQLQQQQQQQLQQQQQQQLQQQQQQQQSVFDLLAPSPKFHQPAQLNPSVSSSQPPPLTQQPHIPTAAPSAPVSATQSSGNSRSLFDLGFDESLRTEETACVEIKSSDVVDVVEETVDSSSKSDKKKKKKKEKHKSKDKERDKEKKHKHKHKDKDKEKHKEKDKHKDRQEIDAPRL